MEFLKIWEIVLRRKKVLIGSFLVFFLTIILVTHLSTPSYRAKAKLLVEDSVALPSLLTGLGLQSSGASATSDAYDTDIALATVRPNLEKLVTELKLKDNDGAEMDPDDLVKSTYFVYYLLPRPYIEVGQSEDSDILEIEAYSVDRAQAALMANKLGNYFINNRVKKTKREYHVAKAFIAKRINEVKKKYYHSLAAIRDFRIKEKSVNLDTETDNLLSKISSLKSALEDNEKGLTGLEKEMSEIKARLKKIEKSKKGQLDFTWSDQVKSLKSKLDDLLVTTSQKRLEVTEEHPEYKQLAKEMEVVRELIKKETSLLFSGEELTTYSVYNDLSKQLIDDYIDKEVAIAKRKIMERFISESQGELLKIPIKYVESSKLEMDLSVDKNLYKNLLDYKAQVGIAEAISLANFKIVEPAIEPEEDDPYFPNKLLNYLLGIFFGGFWGFSVVIFLEYIDNTVKSSDELKGLKNLTRLGGIPLSKQMKEARIISNLPPAGPVVEAYRTLKDNIVYACGPGETKSIVVTSSRELEGRSSVAANLAISFASEVKSAIVVDFDLRKPALHRFFNLDNRAGVTTILTQGIKPREAIVRSGIENLDCLLSGPAPSDPGRIIEPGRVKALIDDLKEVYDIIIIDTPPIISANDAVVIGRHADAFLYVIEPGKVTLAAIEHAQETIERAGGKLAGFVLSKSTLRT